MMSHAAFIAAAYGVSALALAGLALWQVVDYRSQKAALDGLKARDRKTRFGRRAAPAQSEATR